MTRPEPTSARLERRLDELVRAGDESGDGRDGAGLLAEIRLAIDELRRREADADELAAELELERRRYRELFELGPGASVVTSDRGMIREANRRAAELIGIEPRSLVGKPLAVALDIPDRPALRRQMLGAYRGAGASDTELTIVHRQTGERRVVRASVRTGRGGDGAPILRWLFHDVTEERSREAELRALNEELEERVRERTADLEAATAVKDRLLRSEQAARSEAVRLLADVFTERSRLEGVVRTLPLGVILVEPSGDVLLSNEEANRILGNPDGYASLEEARRATRPLTAEGRPFADDERPLTRALVHGQTTHGVESMLESPEGLRWLESSAAPIRDREGAIIAAVLAFRDVTERHRREQRFRLLDATTEVLESPFDARRLLRSLALRTVPDFADWAAVDVLAPDGTLVRLAAAHAKEGLPDAEGPSQAEPLEVEASPVRDALEQGRRTFVPQVDPRLAGALAHEASILGGVQPFDPVSYICVPVRGRASVIAAISFASVGERREFDDGDFRFAVELARRAALAVENASLFDRLEAERARLDVLVDRLGDGVISVRRDLTVELANVAALRLVGGSLEQGSQLPDDWAEGTLHVLARRLFERGAGVVEALVELEAEDRVLEVVGLPARRHATAVLVLRDVSERQRHERAERDFVTNAAHELRTPLTAISGAVEVLQLGAKDVPQERDRFLAHIQHECGRLTRLSEALLILARAQTGEEEPRAERIPVRPLLEDVAAGLVPAPGVDVRVRCRPGLEIFANRSLVEQALVSLGANAAKFTRAGRIELAARAANGSVVLRVSDTGPGIAPAEREDVFRRFHRGDRQAGGFGLGLAIVRDSVRAAGGTVELTSAAGKGTTARLTFPRVEDA